MSQQTPEVKVEGALRACEEQMRKAEYAAREAEHAAKEAEYKSDEVKWRIDGRGIRPRYPARRAWAVRSRRSVR